MLLIRDQLASHPGEVIRLGLLSAHYRQPLDWSPQLVSDARRRVDRMYGALRDAGIEGAATEPPDEPPARVIEALEDDLNTPQALAQLAALVKETNREPDPAARRAKAAELRSGAWMLGLLQQDPGKWFAQAASAGDADGPSDAEIDAMVKRREALRAAAQYSEADQVRGELDALGIVIEDGAGGSRWRRS
jgi:cysteinyl-tRNA synthetase